MLARRHRLISDLNEVAPATPPSSAPRSTRSWRRGTGRPPPPPRGRPSAAAAEERVGTDVALLLARSEAYPDLRADEAFTRLSRELVAAEDDVSAARRYYNGRVRLYHTARESFPDQPRRPA